MLEFLTLKPEAFGLDISDSSLKIVKLEKSGKSLSLASFGKTVIESGVIEKGEIKDEKALTEAIKESLHKVSGKKLNTRYVVASLPEEKSFLQVIQMPNMNKEELKKAVYFEAENYIPLPVDEVYLDFQIVPPVYDHSDHLDVLVVAFPKETVDTYVSSLRRAGLSIKALEVESLAITRVLIKNGLSPHPVLLIDLGENGTGLMIFSGYSLRFTSFMPISSKQFTKTISDALGVGFQEAETLKFKYGLSKKYKIKMKNGIEKEIEPRKISEALFPLIIDLNKRIEKYLSYYSTHVFHEHLSSDGKIVEKILICGGGANLKGISQFLSMNLKVPTELSNPWINIFKEQLQEVPELSFSQSQAFACALGLALRGVKN